LGSAPALCGQNLVFKNRFITVAAQPALRLTGAAELALSSRERNGAVQKLT
jgi:hypothetical protein